MSDDQTQPEETGADSAPDAAPVKADTPPDRLSIHQWSEDFQPEVLARGVHIRFKGEERTNIEEYCISEGWVKVQAGKSLDRKGRPMLLTLKGPVEAWYDDLGDDAPVAKA